VLASWRDAKIRTPGRRRPLHARSDMSDMPRQYTSCYNQSVTRWIAVDGAAHRQQIILPRYFRSETVGHLGRQKTGNKYNNQLSGRAGGGFGPR